MAGRVVSTRYGGNKFETSPVSVKTRRDAASSLRGRRDIRGRESVFPGSVGGLHTSLGASR